MSRRHRTSAVLTSLALLLATSCSDSPEEGTDVPCGNRSFTRDTNVAIAEEAVLTAEAMTSTAPPEVRAITDAVTRFNEANDPLAEGECGPDPAVVRDYLLVIHHLVAHQDDVSPELLGGLLDVAAPGQGGDRGGIEGVYLFVSSSESYDARDYPGLQDLRDTVREQRSGTAA